MKTSPDITGGTIPAAPPSRTPAGARPGRAWALPRGPGCAGHARRVLAGALAAVGATRDVVADARLMVSELATNAYQHAGDHGPHELWLDHDGLGEARCAVFDAYAEAFSAAPADAFADPLTDPLSDTRLPGYSWTSGDCGRGLSIVRELSEGRWGMQRALSRLGPPVRGKAVWFAVPARGPGGPSLLGT
ncbi:MULTISPECIES: ATP-binding protein [Actinomadura]|uniref:ATP-binding protein n=1 Tax=Actinomadura TaxID=1988 RepID=UPI0027E1D43D|nr:MULTISPECIES: ATP-binding protein [Actinomadura]